MQLLDGDILQFIVGKIFAGQMFAPGSYYALGDLTDAGDSAILLTCDLAWTDSTSESKTDDV